MGLSPTTQTVLTWLAIVLCIAQSGMFAGLNLAIFSLSRLRLPKVTLLQLHNSITAQRGAQPTSLTPEDAVLTTADLSCAGVRPGYFCFTSATAPATIGTA